jgi:hypothetical protein
VQVFPVNSIHANRRSRDAYNERALRVWARVGGLVLALVTLLSMAYSADWKLAMMAIDPLVWMMTLVALAAGLVSGYALGMHIHAHPGE